MAEATVSTRSALLATMNSWSSDWAGTATSLGISASASRVIEVANGTYTTMALTYTFPQRVTIRAATKHGPTFGQVTMSGSNTYLDGIKVSAYTYGAIKFEGATDCGVVKCQILGNTSATLADPIDAGYGVQCIGGSDGIVVEDCFIDGYKFGSVNYGCNDVIYRRCFMHSFGLMMHQTSGGATNMLFESQYCSGNYLPEASAHGDFIQLRGGDNITVRKCVFRKSSATGKIARGIPVGDGGLDATNVTLTQNLIATAHVQGAGPASSDTEGGDERSNITVTNNTLLCVTDDPNSNQYLCQVDMSGAGSGSTNSANAQTKTDGGSADSGGIVFEVGPSYAGRDFSAYDAHYDNRPDRSSTLADLIPKASSAMHPNTGTAGCYDLIQDILDGDYPSNWDSTVADPFDTYFVAGDIPSEGGTPTLSAPIIGGGLFLAGA